MYIGIDILRSQCLVFLVTNGSGSGREEGGGDRERQARKKCFYECMGRGERGENGGLSQGKYHSGLGQDKME